MYHYFLFAAIHHLKLSPTFSVRPCSSVGRVTGRSNPEVVGSIPTKVKRFFLCLVWFPVSLANAQWVVHGFKYHLNLHIRVNSLFHYLVYVLV